MRKAGYLLMLLLIAAVTGVAYTMLKATPHEFTGSECGNCHAAAPVRGIRESLRMKAPVSVLCGECHRDMTKFVSHPVEISPAGIELPSDLPLSWDGKMTCSTCHDIHATPHTVFSSRTGLLRRPGGGKYLCSACHALSGSASARSNGHSSVMTKAHMKYIPGMKGAYIDEISKECLSCHDGSVSSSDIVVEGSWRHGSALTRYDPQGNHPMGVKYRRSKVHSGELRPPETLDPVIKLINGRVGCCSCHNPFSREPKMLVMSNNGGRLCLSCHDK